MKRGQPAADQRRPSGFAAAAADDAAEPDAASAPTNEQLLAQLQNASIDALCTADPASPANPRNLSMQFLAWLCDRCGCYSLHSHCRRSPGCCVQDTGHTEILMLRRHSAMATHFA